MSRPTIALVTWNEAEPTGPSGGRLRYSVEAEGPRTALDEEHYFVHVSESNIIHDHVDSTDAMTLSEDDLEQMIAALTTARDRIHQAKTGAAATPARGKRCPEEDSHGVPCEVRGPHTKHEAPVALSEWRKNYGVKEPS